MEKEGRLEMSWTPTKKKRRSHLIEKAIDSKLQLGYEEWQEVISLQEDYERYLQLQLEHQLTSQTSSIEKLCVIVENTKFVYNHREAFRISGFHFVEQCRYDNAVGIIPPHWLVEVRQVSKPGRGYQDRFTLEQFYDRFTDYEGNRLDVDQ